MPERVVDELEPVEVEEQHVRAGPGGGAGDGPLQPLQERHPVGQPGDRVAERVLRGGSWMCSENYCTNYRVAARSHATPDSGLNNLGFRCVSD